MVLDGQHPAIIRNAVATPGGCTIGGLLTMEDGKIRSTMVSFKPYCISNISGSNNSGSDKCRECIRKDTEIEASWLHKKSFGFIASACTAV
jgi:Pyrroline-5-carboxylate reductase dimerisation